MEPDATNKPGDVIERIAQDQILRKLLDDRFDCRHCPNFGRRGRLITRCLQHMEELRAELGFPAKNSER
jgi:hypothetical protein